MKLIEYFCILVILSAFTGCESLEDTYSDYAGDGTMRYIAKCRDLEVTPGWGRLIVTWTNHVDPVIANIKVSWTLDGVTRDTVLEQGATNCNITHLENASYEIAVRNMDKYGNCSLPVTGRERPYTSAHENVLSFTRLVNRHFFLNNRLVLVFGEWQSNIESACLKYSSRGELKELELDSAFITENPYFLVPDPVDAGVAPVVERSGWIKGCPDLIVFEPYRLMPDKIYSPGFKRLLRRKYGRDEITDELLDSIEELEIDYNIDTFEDILYLPNLKRLSLGKNRFLSGRYLDKTRSASEVSDGEASLFALRVASEVNQLDIRRYNMHYFPDGRYPFMQDMENPEVPEVTVLNRADWTFSCSSEEYSGEIGVLFDKEEPAVWNSGRHWGEPERYEITVDMQCNRSLHGVEIIQESVQPSARENSRLAESIQIKVSEDQRSWKDATYEEDNILGNTSGETTLIRFPEVRQVRYVKFILKDQPYTVYFWVSLDKILLF